MIMLKNYVRIALRNLLRHKGYSFINITGLAIGLAAFAIILLFVQNELSYDRHHQKGNDVYRIILDADVMGQAIKTTSTPAPMARTIVDEYPEILAATTVDSYSRVLVTYENQQYYEDEFFLAEASIFDILTLPLVKGDPESALSEPNQIVITEEIAQKYFGVDDPIGKTINVDHRWDFEITGVMRPLSGNTHFEAELIGSWMTSERYNDPEWLNNSFQTYLLLTPGSDPADLETKFPDLIRKYVGPRVEQFLGQTYDQAVVAGLKYEFKLEPLRDIYLRSDAEDQFGRTGNIQYVYIMIAIGLFVLIIASINFMNLSTARATNRAREVGLRKVMGSDRRQLIRQFLGESLVMSFISMVVATGFILLVLPVFNSISGTTLVLESWIFGALVLITFSTGILSGVYPAFVLSGFSPVTVLNGSFASSSRGSYLRSGLVVFQFAISIALLIGTGVVLKQLQFMRTQDLGFDQEQVVVLPVETREGDDRFESFREELMRYTGIVQVAAAGAVPGPDHIHNNTVFRKEGAEDGDYMLAGTAEV
ncbi:MAG: ABC transporter permease, partial [Bacteroidetes bacterium]|nr:ABC transporter permease [Bacteroidota bacterium]